jgi:hypothetical protein
MTVNQPIEKPSRVSAAHNTPKSGTSVRGTRSKVKTLATLALVTWVASLFGVSALSLPLPNIGFAQDLGLMLDAGWRYHQGLRPHADYHSPFGPLLGILFGVPMSLFGPSYGSLRFLPASISAVFAVWCWAVCGTSLRPLSRFLVSTTTGAVAGGIYHQGFPPEILTFATFYNRVGFGLLSIVIIAALFPPNHSGRPSGLLRDISIVIGVTLLVFFKANFAVIAMPFAAWSLFQRRRTRTDWLSLGCIWVLLLAFFLAQIGFRPDLMLFDLRMAASARSHGVHYLFFPIRNALANYDFVGLMIVQSAALAWPMTSWSIDRYRSLRMLGMVWLPALAGFALTLTQSHGDGRGILLVVSGMAAALASRFSTGDERRDDAMRIRHTLASLSLGLACLLFLFPHAKSYWTLHQVSVNPGPPPFPPGHLRELYVGPLNDLNADYVPAMREALELLSTNCRPPQSLQFFGGCNIFTFATGMRSPRCSMLFWCGMSTFSESLHPRPEEFSDTDFILRLKDKYVSLDTFRSWQPIYSYVISSQYVKCDEGQYFELLRRRAMNMVPNERP